MKNLRPLLSVNSAPAVSEPVSKVPYDIMKVAKSKFCRVVYPPRRTERPPLVHSEIPRLRKLVGRQLNGRGRCFFACSLAYCLACCHAGPGMGR